MSASAPQMPPALLEAVAFAARAHRAQLRKDNETPYVSHVVRVCLIVRHLFGIEDADALTAAVLHDTLEDTTTDYDDLIERFGATVAGWVAALSKDKRLPEEEREAAYVKTLRGAPWQVKVCKLADIYDNLSDSASLNVKGRKKSLERSRLYLSALQSHLPREAERAFEIVSRQMASLEQKAS
jgi:guanosine-3',5'-bis(diphosphate) 3'-pyrophosphohydrolase